MATTKTRKKTRKSPKKSAKKSARKPAAKKTAKSRARKPAAKKTAKKGGLELMKRGSGYSQINTLTLTTAQATQLGKLMRSHRCTGKGQRTVCTTKTGRVVAVITSNR